MTRQDKGVAPPWQRERTLASGECFRETIPGIVLTGSWLLRVALRPQPGAAAGLVYNIHAGTDANRVAKSIA